MVTEARRLMRMARSRQRKLDKEIKEFEKVIASGALYISPHESKSEKIARMRNQADIWDKVVDWLDMQLTLLSTQQEESDGEHKESSIGESYQLTDEEKRELLGKLTPDMTRAFAQAYADFIFKCEAVGIRVSGVSFYPEGKGKPQHD